MRSLILNIRIILLCAFGAAQDYFLTGPWLVLGVACGLGLLVRRIMAAFGVMVPHIFVLPVPQTGAGRIKSRGLPEIFVGVSGEKSGFLGFYELVYDMACFDYPRFGYVKCSDNRASPAVKPAIRNIALPKRMFMTDTLPPAFI